MHPGDNKPLAISTDTALPATTDDGLRDAPVKDALIKQVKVVEFGGYALGPCIGKYLANFGAQVVHLESKQRRDRFRLEYPHNTYRHRASGVCVSSRSRLPTTCFKTGYKSLKWQ